MICKEIVRGNLCSRTCFEDDKRCYIHIRKWLQNQLKKYDIVIDFPRTCKKVTDALNLVKSTDPTYKDCHGNNILHNGAMENDVNLIKQGIEIGINISSRTDFGNYSPLHLIRDNINLMQICLKSGAIVDALDYYGDTPLMMSCNHCYYSEHKERVKLLLEWGADPTIKNINGVSPCEVMRRKTSITLYENVMQKQTLNLLTIVNVWNTTECINWRQSILSRFIKKLPNVSNKGSLFDALYENLELSHILCIQYV